MVSCGSSDVLFLSTPEISAGTGQTLSLLRFMSTQHRYTFGLGAVNGFRAVFGHNSATSDISCSGTEQQNHHLSIWPTIITFHHCCTWCVQFSRNEDFGVYPKARVREWQAVYGICMHLDLPAAYHAGRRSQETA